ncbi:hypothetical protein [Cohaesibacter gelatinilyticus]|uniref:Uncharacterized protein n=1 Tax=Cohaesibacter gelatinilyticus TaxID=372072 RepID=A0A285PIV4_9HYPH|nr:hypothetical protein [Cohaesibacter gelatinilyticus]SNZ21670.1 hypothetical protein SAMN06265368_4795 [Cohaesibacter gelatinilyticus]
MSSRIAPLPSPIMKGQRKRPRKCNKDNLVAIRELPCILTGVWPVEAAHLRSGCLGLGKRDTGMQEKPDDAYVVPLSPAKHREQHSMNEIEFWKAHGFEWRDIVAIAQALYQHRNDLEARHVIIQEARRWQSD